jgi:hypothetical protein
MAADDAGGSYMPMMGHLRWSTRSEERFGIFRDRFYGWRGALLRRRPHRRRRITDRLRFRPLVRTANRAVFKDPRAT